MAFATPEDVAARLGRDLGAQVDMADLLLDGATAVVANAAGKTEEWAAALDPVPGLLRIVTVELVARAMSNPDGARQTSERLGEYQHITSYRDSGGGLWLTDIERRLVGQAVHGNTAGFARTVSIIDDGTECCS